MLPGTQLLQDSAGQHVGLSFADRVRRISDSPELSSIRQMMPISFVGLVIGMVAFFFSADGAFQARFFRAFADGFGVMSAVLVLLLAWDLAGRRGVPRALATIVAAIVFALSLPHVDAPTIEKMSRAIGSSGLFLAIAIGLVVVHVLRLTAFLTRPRAAIGLAIGSAILVCGALELRHVGVSPVALIDRAIAPLGHLGDSLTALLIIVAIEMALWTIGIHGPALLAAVVLPVYLALLAQNGDALARGEPLPHIVTVSTFLFLFPGGSGATLPLVLMLLRSRVKRVRTVAAASLVPAIFNTNEPLMFGLPLVLNPVLAVPFILVPLVLCVTTYSAMSLGLVQRPSFYVPSATPTIIAAFIVTKDWRAVVLTLVNLGIATAIWWPFAAIYERAERARDAAAG